VPVWIEVAAGVISGLVIVGAIFWYTFGRMPERRSDAGLIQHEAAHYASGDDGDDHHSS
jgi:hypothetical protein